MRILYLLLWGVYKISFRLYFNRIVVLKNSPFLFGRTIFVSNHPGSLMDPLLIAAARNPIVFFMTRSDVFNTFTKPILWAVHMLPIYRQRDGVDTQKKNARIFEKTNYVLNKNRNILIFGEGFTDDNTPRHLFPIKKGALRIGFSALEFMDWKKDVFIQGIGVNYMDPQLRETDVVINSGEPIKLNDYRSLYEENPNKALTEITRILEKDMRSLVTDVHDLDWAEFHEQTMMLTRKGMNGISYDSKLPVEHRLTYSMKLAAYLNGLSEGEKKQLEPLRKEIASYFNNLHHLGINEGQLVQTHIEKKNFLALYFKLLFLAPAFILGLIHTAIPYLWVKRFVERKLKRPVFWPGTKLTMAMFLVPIFNLPVVFYLFTSLSIFQSVPLSVWILYFIAIAPISALYLSFVASFNLIFSIRKLKKMDLNSQIDKRSELLNQLEKVITL